MCPDERVAIKQGKSMDEQRIATDRVDIARRVADFRETQARFQLEREAYYEATIEKVRAIGWNESAGRPLSN
jgi:hypothetical protein